MTGGEGGRRGSSEGERERGHGHEGIAGEGLVGKSREEPG